MSKKLKKFLFLFIYIFCKKILIYNKNNEKWYNFLPFFVFLLEGNKAFFNYIIYRPV